MCDVVARRARSRKLLGCAVWHKVCGQGRRGKRKMYIKVLTGVTEVNNARCCSWPGYYDLVAFMTKTWNGYRDSERDSEQSQMLCREMLGKVRGVVVSREHWMAKATWGREKNEKYGPVCGIGMSRRHDRADGAPCCWWPPYNQGLSPMEMKLCAVSRPASHCSHSGIIHRRGEGVLSRHAGDKKETIRCEGCSAVGSPTVPTVEEKKIVGSINANEATIQSGKLVLQRPACRCGSIGRSNVVTRTGATSVLIGPNLRQSKPASWQVGHIIEMIRATRYENPTKRDGPAGMGSHMPRGPIRRGQAHRLSQNHARRSARPRLMKCRELYGVRNTHRLTVRPQVGRCRRDAVLS